jgi:hypothetical protein
LTWRTATPSSPAIRWSTDWFWVTQQLCQRDRVPTPCCRVDAVEP